MQLILKLGKSYAKHYAGVSTQSWQGILLSLIESTLIGVIYFLTLYFVDELHFTVAAAGTLISFYGIGAIIGGIVGGKLCDHYHPGSITIFSLALQALGYFALCIMMQFNSLAITLFILGIGSYAFITSNQLWVINKSGEEEHHKLKAINLLSTASNLGLAISAVVISVTYQFGFKLIFFITGAVLILLTIGLVLKNNTVLLKSEITKCQPNKIIRKPQKNTALNFYILSAVFFIGMIVSQLGTTYPLYIQSYFSSSGLNAISFLFALNSILVVFFETPTGNLLGKYKPLSMVGLGSFLIGFGMMILPFSSSFIIALISCVIYTFGEIIFFCMSQFICYQISETNKKGQGLGTFRMIYATSRIAGPIAGASIYHHLGENMIWYLSGILGVIYLLGSGYFRNQP